MVKHPTLDQIMISQFMGSSPVSSSVLTAQSLEPASDSVFSSLSLSLSLSLSQRSPARALVLSVSVSKIKKNNH